jgi:hypothetical protein
VLHKLGFRPTGAVVDRFSAGRGAMAPCKLFELDLGQRSAARESRRVGDLVPA